MPSRRSSSTRWPSTARPGTAFLAGNDRALTDVQLAGAKNFMSARCSICHNGPAFTDNLFHNVALAQFGPGEGDGAGGLDDFGRMRVTGNAAEQYAFRTTPLRNVELTGPWGHAGQFTNLRAFVDHYSESDIKLRNFDVMQLEALLRGTVLPTTDAILATRDPLLTGVVFPAQRWMRSLHSSRRSPILARATSSASRPVACRAACRWMAPSSPPARRRTTTEPVAEP